MNPVEVGERVPVDVERASQSIDLGIMPTFMVMIKRAISATFVVFSLGATSVAQKTGTLRMLIEPGTNFEFVVDHKYRMQQREVKLGEGLHHFSFWAPERNIVDTSVFVIADRTSDLVLRLPYSPEYVQFRKDMGNYENGRLMRKLSPVLLVGGLVWTGLSISSYGKAKDQLDMDRTAYATGVDPATITRLKINIEEHNADLRKARTSLYAGTALSVVGAGVIYYVWHKTKAKGKPVFEDKERVRFDGLSWMPDRQGGFWYAGLTIPLDR